MTSVWTYIVSFAYGLLLLVIVKGFKKSKTSKESKNDLALAKSLLWFLGIVLTGTYGGVMYTLLFVWK